MPRSSAASTSRANRSIARLAQAKCSYTLQKRPFPKAGSPEYVAIQQQILQSLVQRAELAQKAPGLGVKVTDAQVEKQLKQIKKQYFGGSEKRYQAELKKQCVTDAEVRSDVGANVLLGLDLQEGDDGREGDRQPRSRRTTTRTRRSTRSPRRASSATSWSRTRRSPTSSTAS